MKAPYRSPGKRPLHRALVGGVLGAALPSAGSVGGGRGEDGDGTARDAAACDGRIEGAAHLTVWFPTAQRSESGTRPYPDPVRSAASGGAARRRHAVRTSGPPDGGTRS